MLVSYVTLVTKWYRALNLIVSLDPGREDRT